MAIVPRLKVAWKPTSAACDLSVFSLEEISLCTGVLCPRTVIMEHNERIEKILAAHNSVQSCNALSEENGRNAIQAAIVAGELLHETKDTVEHGKFTAWLKENCKDISVETARRYIRLAKRSHKTDLSDCTSLRQAYLATGTIPDERRKKVRSSGTATASTGSTASGATQTSTATAGFSGPVITSSVAIPLADKPALNEMVEMVMFHLDGLASDDEIKAALVTLAPCGAWYVKQSERMREIVAA